MAILHGTQYQERNRSVGKLCDRILFYGIRGLALVTVELKGGRNARFSEVISQIQNGLTIASDILGEQTVSGWFPVLLYDGGLTPYETSLLQNTRVLFKGESESHQEIQLWHTVERCTRRSIAVEATLPLRPHPNSLLPILNHHIRR